jgi:hypothetical protein
MPGEGEQIFNNPACHVYMLSLNPGIIQQIYATAPSGRFTPDTDLITSPCSHRSLPTKDTLGADISMQEQLNSIGISKCKVDIVRHWLFHSVSNLFRSDVFGCIWIAFRRPKPYTPAIGDNEYFFRICWIGINAFAPLEIIAFDPRP